VAEQKGGTEGDIALYSLIVVDDEEEIRRGIIENVDWKEWGFTVVAEAADGEEALEKIGDLKPNVVLTDMRMPGMDGVVLMQRIRVNSPDTKIIVLSGYTDFEYLQKSIKSEVSAYLLKPTDMEAFEEAFAKVRRQLDEQRAEKQERERIEGLLQESPAYMREQISARDRYQSGHEKLVERVMEFIDREFASPQISLQAIADHVRKNPAYISKVFKEVTGDNYVRYLRRKRLAKTLELLRDSPMLVSEAARLAGFSDQSTFIKLFKREYGVTPSEYVRSKREP